MTNGVALQNHCLRCLRGFCLKLYALFMAMALLSEGGVSSDQCARMAEGYADQDQKSENSGTHGKEGRNSEGTNGEFKTELRSPCMCGRHQRVSASLACELAM